MAILAFALGLTLGLLVGALLWRRTAQIDWTGGVTVEEDPEPSELMKTWRPRMSPGRYLRQFPDGEYAEQAQRIVGDSRPLNRSPEK